MLAEAGRRDRRWALLSPEDGVVSLARVALVRLLQGPAIRAKRTNRVAWGLAMVLDRQADFEGQKQ
jgi:hypothetical protein